jgi:hypothetical protein
VTACTRHTSNFSLPPADAGDYDGTPVLEDDVLEADRTMASEVKASLGDTQQRGIRYIFEVPVWHLKIKPESGLSCLGLRRAKKN